jgi:amino acid transporter
MSQVEVGLARSLNLPLLVLYGLGVTIGAGIYVLVGVVAARAGMFAPVSFVVAALVMSFTALSFGELAARFPVSAGEAAYVREGLRSTTLSFVTGSLVIISGTVSSAAIAIGCTGYLSEFTALPGWLLIVAVVLVVGCIAAWGILESVMLAALFTLIEAGGLIAIIVAGFVAAPDMLSRFGELVPQTLDLAVWSTVLSAGLLAFFAFIGFEDLVNVAEESRDPVRDLPRAIIITLLVTTVIYFLVVSVSVLSVPPAELGASSAPLVEVFRRVAPVSPAVITVIAIFATLNTMIVQVIMVARVIYGMAKLGNLPRVLATVDRRTRTPLIATALVVSAVLILALGFPLEGLAEMTSRVALTIFTLCNVSLFALKIARRHEPVPGFVVPIWVPATGAVTCVAFLVVEFLAA